VLIIIFCFTSFFQFPLQIQYYYCHFKDATKEEEGSTTRIRASERRTDQLSPTISPRTGPAHRCEMKDIHGETEGAKTTDTNGNNR
jgi:hypothetical protein